jgi:CBS domain-containing protein
MDTHSYQASEVGIFAAEKLVRVAADATLNAVAEALDSNDVGAVIVGLDSIDGIVSERDLVRAVAALGDTSVLRAGDIASRDIVYCDARATIDDAAELMLERYVRHLLVEDGSKVIGIVSARDLLGAFVTR